MSWTISAGAVNRLRTAHVAQPRVYWVDSGAVRHYVPITAGTVALDGNALVRSTCTLALPADEDVWEEVKLFPFGTRVWVEYGIGSIDLYSPTEYVPFGQFIVEKVSRAEPGATIELTGSDLFRMSQWHQFGWATKISVSTYRDVLVYLINYLTANPSNTYGTNPTVPVALGAIFDPARDRLAYIREYADAMNTDVWADREGLWSARPQASAPGVSQWLIDAGASGVLVGDTDERNSEQTRNVVYVSSEPTVPGEVQIRVRAQDGNPTSPTYYLGPFGWRTLVYPAGFVKDATALANLAAAVLKRRLGLLRAVTVSLPPTPHLDPGDTVELLLPDAATSELRSIVGLTVDLAGGATQIKLDEHRTLA